MDLQRAGREAATVPAAPPAARLSAAASACTRRPRQRCYCGSAGWKHEQVRLSPGRLQGECHVSYQLRQVRQVFGSDQAAGSGSGQWAVSAIYLQTRAGNLKPPASCLCVCLTVFRKAAGKLYKPAGRWSWWCSPTGCPAVSAPTRPPGASGPAPGKRPGSGSASTKYNQSSNWLRHYNYISKKTYFLTS